MRFEHRHLELNYAERDKFYILLPHTQSTYVWKSTTTVGKTVSWFWRIHELNSVALVRKQTILTAAYRRVGANFCGYWVSRGQRNGLLRPLISVF
jgi:hypothetical protein